MDEAFEQELTDAVSLGHRGEHQACLEALSGLVDRYPNEVKAHLELAMHQLMLGMREEGCASLRGVLALDPHHELALQISARC